MKLQKIRVFAIEQDIAVDMSNVNIVDNIVTKDGNPVTIEGYEQVSLKDRTIKVVPVNLETAKVLYAPKKRGRPVDEDKRKEAIRRIEAGDKISEISFDLRLSNVFLYALKKKLAEDQEVTE